MISRNTLLKLSVQYLKHIGLSSKGTDALIFLVSFPCSGSNSFVSS